jgi:hypothetical protein
MQWLPHVKMEYIVFKQIIFHVSEKKQIIFLTFFSLYNESFLAY